MIRLGITGGIGSGKSVVISLLRILGIPVYIADEESKRLTNTDIRIRESLIASFGKELYSDDRLNKQLLASIIFNNQENLRLVNSIIHPVVLDDFMKWSVKYEQVPFVAMETAILFESSLNRYVDKVIVVTAPLEIRLKRATHRDGVKEEMIMKRITNQMPEEEKCKLADFVIYNDGVQAVIPQLEKIIRQYQTWN